MTLAGRDRAHYHLTRIHTNAHLDWQATFGADTVGVPLQRLLHSDCRVECALRMIFMGDWRAKERKDAVTRRLGHVTAIMMGRVHH
jgi:hypothetical protein